MFNWFFALVVLVLFERREEVGNISLEKTIVGFGKVLLVFALCVVVLAIGWGLACVNMALFGPGGWIIK